MQTVAGGVAFVSLVVSTQRCFTPTPVVFMESEVHGSGSNSDPPKSQFKFGNVGLSPMFIHSFRLLADGREVNGFSSILAKEEKLKFALTSESGMFQYYLQSPELFGEFEPPRVHIHGYRGIISIVTVRPREGNEWNDDFRQILVRKRVQIEVRYSTSQFPVLCWWKRTVRLDVLNNPKIESS